MKKLLVVLLSLCMLLAVGCAPSNLGGNGGGGGGGGGGDGEDEITPITIMLSGWVNTPIDKDLEDPFREYLKENYKIDVTLQSYSATDFEQMLTTGLAGSTKPDLIVFGSVDQFNKYYDQEVLIDDFGAWIDKAPVLKETMDANDFMKTKVYTEDGAPKALYGNAEKPTWSLRVRKDWVADYASAKGLGEDYTIKTPDELLDFARWIKVNETSSSGDPIYPFTSAGAGNSIGTTLEWTQNMFGWTINGLGNNHRMGFYITEDGKSVSNPIIDGSYEKWLEFLRTLVEENLIYNDWFTQDWGTKGGQLYAGLTAFDWYPGSALVSETYSMNKEVEETNMGVDTLDWWGSMAVPSDGSYGSGVVPTSGDVGKIWSVSYETSLSSVKMEKIMKLLNDLIVTYGDDPTIPEYYERSATYDALRWGVGTIEGTTYEPIEGSSSVACNTDPTGTGEDLRSVNPGTWDYGAFFSTRSDGVIQITANDEISMEMAAIGGSLDNDTGLMELLFCPGASFVYDATKCNEMFEAYVTFTYQYMYGTNTETIAQFQQRWRTTLGGDAMIEEATRQYKELGYMD